MRVLYLTLFLLLAGCASSKPTEAPTEESIINPILGSWEHIDSGNTIHFLSTGTVTIEPGDLLAAINRFQNTQRNRYTSHLLNSGRYEISSENELTLYVTADWTGKGRGARRPQEKRVTSSIIFELEQGDHSTLVLKKKNLLQEGEESLNSEEELHFSLIPIE